MKFSAVLATAVLSASAVLAAPGTAARRARNAEKIAKRASGVRSSKPMIPANFTGQVEGPKDLQADYSTNWAGAVLIGSGYKGVSGEFTIPDPSLPFGSSSGGLHSASAWVGIDGDTCETAILQTGVDFNNENGQVSFDAWYEWYPDYSYDFSGIGFSVGDKVRVSIDATSTRAGVATVENLSKGTKVSHTFSGESDALCETNAEWIVEDFTEISGGSESLVPLVDFGTVTFTDAYATTSGGTVGLSGATVIDMINEEGTSVVAATTIEGSNSVAVTYTG
ncbi:hypothetical protein AAFC00_006580 [Neodothiora populina]|uniref:Aspergillopepsin-2 n=1 Tax=Neodothiora populina TaxID=2781224 RepID=A0ABR3PAF4_9PEZI